ncbi:MAG: hypothetical protein A2687_02205 [Candidatus Levybacteria bacterium RIFCSPHIGHO2_01_FULL_38_26]|nr:MAG: hypothetical protein A2687_02205 [Candidatus Levybacteria bacterium RIFCSPHIGHO2_01_FULL_38_26]
MDGQKGQVFLIVLMAMVIVFTVGLSIASRSIVTVRTTREERDSQRALSAAETGIERSLRTGTSISAPVAFSGDPGTKYTTSVDDVDGTQILINGGNLIPKDEGADIWLVPHDSNNDPILVSPWNGNLRIYWGSASDVCDPSPAVNTMAAIEVAIVYDSDPSPVTEHTLTRAVYDPCGPPVNRRGNNSFVAAQNGIFTFGGASFSHRTPLINISSGFVIRVVPLYSSANMGVTSSNPLPSQGTVVDSTGESYGTSRKIRVFRGFPSLPSQFFLYGLFSP